MNIADVVKKQTDRILRQQRMNGTGAKIITGNPSGDPVVTDPAAAMSAHIAADDHPQYLNETRHNTLNHTGLIGIPADVLSGSSAPTPTTLGQLGQFYVETTTPKLYYCSAVGEGTYTWSECGSSYTLPQATESALGGIKANLKTAFETQEVKIDEATGKLYVPPAGAAANGLPPGGSAGQMLYKNSGTDYDAYWDDAPSGGAVTDSVWGGM